MEMQDVVTEPKPHLVPLPTIISQSSSVQCGITNGVVPTILLNLAPLPGVRANNSIAFGAVTVTVIIFSVALLLG